MYFTISYLELLKSTFDVIIIDLRNLWVKSTKVVLDKTNITMKKKITLGRQKFLDQMGAQEVTS